MNNNLILAGLFAAVLVTSGCVDALDSVDEDLPEDLDDFESEEQQEDTTVDETEEESPSENETVEDPEDTQESETEESESDETEASQEDDVDRTVEIVGGPGTTYDTDEVGVEEGETVEFVYNHEGGQHDLVLERDGENVEGTEVLTSSGETDRFTYTFEEEGSYEFYCSVGTHRQSGMEGDIIFS